MKIGVIGPRGRLGSALVRQDDEVVPLNLDIRDFEEMERYFQEHAYDAVINCAAVTAVDKCEHEPTLSRALRVNTRGPGYLRMAYPGYLIHISTGFVFDGESGPYTEADKPAPLGRYAWSKYGGEIAVTVRPNLPTLIVRTLDLFGGPSGRSDFVKSVLLDLALHPAVSLPAVLMKTPTYIPHLADAILKVTHLAIRGIMNLAGSRTMSSLEWGREIAEAYGMDSRRIVNGPIKGLAPRPLGGGLLTGLAASKGIAIRDPHDGLAEMLMVKDRGSRG